MSFRMAAVWLLSSACCIASPSEPQSSAARELIDLGYAIMDPASPEVSALANGGNPIAEFVVGAAHLQGFRLPKDPARAVNLLTSSAMQGFVPAQFVLAALYLGGDTAIDPDTEKI